MHVLLVEPDPDRLEPLQRCVSGLGFEGAVCKDSGEAWALWQREAQPLIVAASDLPERAGLDLCRRLRRAEGQAPYVLLIVSKRTDEDLRLALEAGADDVLVRPVDEDELRLRLHLAEGRLTVRHRARRQHRSFMDLLAQAPDLIQTAALDGQLIYVNPAWCEALGYAESEIGDLNIFDTVAPAERAAVRKAFRWVKGGRGIRHLQTELMTKDGRVIHVEGSLAPRFRGKTPTSVRAILHDVSRRTRAETVLRNVLEGTSATVGTDFFRSLVKNLSQALQVRHALVARVVDGQRTRLRTLAVWAEDGFRQNHEFELDDMPQASVAADAPNTASLFPGARFLAAAGAESYLGVPLINAEGRSIGLLCVFHDGRLRAGPGALRILSTFAQRATAEVERLSSEARRREMDQRMQESQKLESLGVLAGGIAHDFNNLLTSIMGYASLAKMKSAPTAPVVRYLEDIEAASRRAADLATQMLAYSGKGQFVIQPLDLREIIEDTVALLRTDAHSRGVSLAVAAPAVPAAVEGDDTQVRQVFMNLVLNAAQSMPQSGGRVEVEVGEQEVESGAFRGCYVGADHAAGRYVVVRVRDQGCGMDAETIRRIFEPFFSTRPEGRGLGLAAVVGIVRGHRGALRVESAPGRGTTFTVYLPCCDLAIPPAQGTSPAAAPTGEGLILVVDDERDLRRLTTSILESGGYRVMTAADGQAGVEVFEEHADEIDAVLLDMTMPVMGGVEAFRAMRRIRPEIRVILSSGYTQSEAIARFPGGAPSSFIKKPYTAAELLERVAAVLGAGAVST